MVLNLARTLPMTQAVAAGDRALALGLTRQQLGAGLSAMEHWPGGLAVSVPQICKSVEPSSPCSKTKERTSESEAVARATQLSAAP